MEAKKETIKKTTKSTATTKTAPKKTVKAEAKTTSTTKKASVKATEVANEKAVAETPAKTVVAEKKVAKKNQPMLKITLVRSTIGCLRNQKRTIEAMGLKKIRSTVMMPDNACTRGMIYVVKHLVSVEQAK